MEDYEKQAQQFLKETGTTFAVAFKEYGFHFVNEKDKRDIYTITLKRGSRSYSFDFGQSLNNSGFKLLDTYNKEIKYTWFDELTFNEDRDEVKLKHDLKKNLGQLPFYSGNITAIKNRKLNPSILISGNLKIKLPKEPNAYDVLAGLTKYDPETLKDFCDSYGYDKDSRTAEKIYLAVVKEYENLKMLFSDEELIKLQDIN
jgi:hypothetical protein